MLQPGLGKEKHMETALKLPSPYKPGTTTDPDLRFAAYTMAIWGPFIGQWRHQQQQLLGGLMEAVRPLTEALRRRMPKSVRQVAEKKDPAMVAMTTVLMRWPDRNLAVEYVTGHRIVGHVEASGVFRARGGQEITEEELMTGFLGQEAVAYIVERMDRSLLRRRGRGEVDAGA